MPTNHSEELRLLIVDDEKEACDNIRSILAEFIDPYLNVVGVAHDTTEAEELIGKLQPNAVFLDIEMPGENAFQFLQRIHPHNFDIVFITAYDEFAIRAFKLNAIDYILKPVNIDELAEAVSRLRDRLTYKLLLKNNAHQVNVLMEIANKERSQKITLRSLNHIEVVEFKDIYFIEGRGNYCRICFNRSGTPKEITTSNTLSFYEELLPPRLFYRIHKSHIVNCSHIDEIISDGTYYHVITKNKEKIQVSRRRYGGFIDFLNENDFQSV